MAVATEQEMKARVEEMRAKVVSAEAEVPLAMAEALTFRKYWYYGLYELQKYSSRYRNA